MKYKKFSSKKLTDAYLEKKLSITICKGVEEKFIVKRDDGLYICKYSSTNKPTSIGEVFYAFLCEKLSVPVVDISFSNFTIKDTNYEGVVSKCYITGDVLESIPYSAMLDYYERKDPYGYSASDGLCTKYTLMSAIKLFAKNNNLELDPNIDKIITQMIILDYVTNQNDRNISNVEFLVCEGKNGKKILKLAPLFDNGRCFRFQLFENGIVPKNLKQGTVVFSFNDVNPYSLDIAQYASSNLEAINFLIQILSLDINMVIDEFNQKNNSVITDDYRSVITKIWDKNNRDILNKLYSIAEVINPNEKENVFSTRLQKFFSLTNSIKLEYNYLFDRELNKNNPQYIQPSLEEYVRQYNEYKFRLLFWSKYVLTEEPDLKDFPLLMPRKDIPEMSDKVKNMVVNSKNERLEYIKDLKFKVSKLDFFRLYRIQKRLDFESINQQRPHSVRLQNFISEEESEFYLACDNYIKDGFFTSKPLLVGYYDLSEKKYSSDAIYIYIRECINEGNLSQEAIDYAIKNGFSYDGIKNEIKLNIVEDNNDDDDDNYTE